MDKRVICICGVTHKESNTNRHLNSRNHMNYMNDPLETKIKQERYKKTITCICGSKYIFKNQMWLESHERSYKHCKFLNYKL
jgi:hypothetical protein